MEDEQQIEKNVGGRTYLRVIPILRITLLTIFTIISVVILCVTSLKIFYITNFIEPPNEGLWVGVNAVLVRLQTWAMLFPGLGVIIGVRAFRKLFDFKDRLLLMLLKGIYINICALLCAFALGAFSRGLL